jgi:hypothetical protein
MTTAPQIAPLALLSEVRADINADPAAADTANRIRSIIQGASAHISRACQRRFDERIETRYYTPWQLGQGGDLYGRHDLLLDDDLRAVTTIINGDGAPITSGYLLLPRAPANSVASYRTIRLSSQGATYWQSGLADPTGSIAVTGTWGYGGQWVATGATLAAGANIGDTTLTVSSGALVEIGMTLRIGTEYLYVHSVAANAVGVVRGVYGSVAASHNSGAALSRWQAHDTVQSAARRLTLWRMAQNMSPLFGQAVIGDLAFPVQTDALPADVLALLRDTGLLRLIYPTAV